MPRSARFLLVIAILLCAAGSGFYVTTLLGPERLHREVVGWLEGATKAEVEIASLRLVLGFPIRLEGTGLRLWNGALSVESAGAHLDVVSVLLGRPRLKRLRLDGAHLRAERTQQGVWEPPIFKPGDGQRPEPALAPLRSIEGVIRFLLTKPLLADTLVVRRSRVTLVHPAPDGARERVQLVFESVNGRLLHSRLFGDARLSLRVRLEQDGGDRGRIEWTGSRDEAGAMDVTMAATALDLSSFASYVRAARPAASLAGLLDGVAEFETSEPGVGRLDLDIGVTGLETSFADADADAEPLRLPSATLRVAVELDHDRVVLSKGRVGADEFDFTLDADIERPLRDASRAEVRVSLADLAMNPEIGRKLAGWLPTSARARAVSLAERLRSGRLSHAELRGVAPVALWGRVLAGSLGKLPTGFRVAIELDDVAIDVDEANRLEHLNASMAFENDTLDVARASVDLNGGPLPELQVSFQGLSKLLASPPAEREMTSTAEALVGLTPLFDFLSGDPEGESSASPQPKVTLTFEQLHHPALIWPMYDVEVELAVDADPDGVRIDVTRCAWAGVLLDGWVDWTLRPQRRVVIDLVATEARAVSEEIAGRGVAPLYAGPVAEGAEDTTWVEGRFEVGAYDSPGWSQSGARGRFSAAGGELRLEDIAIDLTPRGVVSGWLDLDLTHAESVPYEAHVAMAGADLETLIAQRGAEGRFATGILDVSARLDGSIVPGRPLLHDAKGDSQILARKGAILRRVPAVFALALASRSLNPFASRDELRYKRGAAELVFDSGRITTNGFSIEGPDLRLFATGGLDLRESPHPIEAEVVLFLFRQVDRALELIPILNVLLLGENENLLAAYFELMGTWEEPVAKAKPLRSLGEGPGDVLTKGIPRVMMRGMQAIGGLFRGNDGNAAPQVETDDDAGSPSRDRELDGPSPAKSLEAPTPDPDPKA